MKEEKESKKWNRKNNKKENKMVKGKRKLKCVWGGQQLKSKKRKPKKTKFINLHVSSRLLRENKNEILLEMATRNYGNATLSFCMNHISSKQQIIPMTGWIRKMWSAIIPGVLWSTNQA